MTTSVCAWTPLQLETYVTRSRPYESELLDLRHLIKLARDAVVPLGPEGPPWAIICGNGDAHRADRVSHPAAAEHVGVPVDHPHRGARERALVGAHEAFQAWGASLSIHRRHGSASPGGIFSVLRRRHGLTGLGLQRHCWRHVAPHTYISQKHNIFTAHHNRTALQNTTHQNQQHTQHETTQTTCTLLILMGFNCYKFKCSYLLLVLLPMFENMYMFISSKHELWTLYLNQH
jgi:hypothetical protein